MKKILTLLMTLLFVFALFAPAAAVAEEEQTMTISEKGEAIYKKSYDSMTGRTDERGYAPTSIMPGSTYAGMFVRDSSIQLMSHIVNGDLDYAKKILNFMVGAHLAVNDGLLPDEDAHRAYHVLRAYTDNYVGNNYVKDIELFEAFDEEAYNTDNQPALVQLGGNVIARQEIVSDKVDEITAVDVLISKIGAPEGQLVANLYKGENRKMQTKYIDLADIENGWLTLKFNQPISYEMNLPVDSFYLEISAPDAIPGSVIWHGSLTEQGWETTVNNAGTVTDITGEAAFNARTSTLAPLSGYHQVDGNYMFVNSWALYVQKAPLTPEHQDFIKDSYEFIRRCTSFYLDNYFDSEYSLLNNPNLEHSRQGYYLDTYDLITNVYASEALHKMIAIAEDMGDAESAAKWQDFLDRINKGIEENLITDYEIKDEDGNPKTVKIYGELIYKSFTDPKYDGKFTVGFSWVNLSPIGCDWYYMDDEIMENTYVAYKQAVQVGQTTSYKNALFDYSYTIGGEQYHYNALTFTVNINPELDPTKITGISVISKGFAWELMWCVKQGYTERVAEMENFAATNNVSGYYPESWWGGVSTSDIANQEHANWLIVGFSTIKFKDDVYRKVEFDRNGAEGMLPSDRLYKKGTTFVLPECGLEKEGYVFKGWSDGSTLYSPGAQFVADNADFIFTAVFEAKAGTDSGNGTNDTEKNNTGLIIGCCIGGAAVVGAACAVAVVSAKKKGKA